MVESSVMAMVMASNVLSVKAGFKARLTYRGFVSVQTMHIYAA